MKLLPKLGLGTIYIAPLCKGLILLEHVSENLGMGMGRKVLGTQPHPTVGQPPLIVFQILISSKGLLIARLFYTHAH